MNRRVLLSCNAPRSPGGGMVGNLLDTGAVLAERGWEPVWCFAPESPRVSYRVERQLAYGRVVSAVWRWRPAAAIVSSADGVLVPLLAPGTPLVVRSHGLEVQRREATPDALRFGVGHRLVREPALRLAVRQAEAVVVSTQPERTFVEARLAPRPGAVHVIPNGIDEEWLTAPRAPATRPTVTWIGGWTATKGIDVLPAVLAGIVAAGIDVELVLLGVGVPEVDVRVAFPAALQGHLRVIPRLSREGVLGECSAAWAGLATSTYEGFGRGMLELAAAGLPLVATPVGVAPDLLAGGGGHLVERGDADAMAGHLVRLLRDPDAAARTGAEARAAAARFGLARIAEAWDDLLNDVAA